MYKIVYALPSNIEYTGLRKTYIEPGLRFVQYSFSSSSIIYYVYIYIYKCIYIQLPGNKHIRFRHTNICNDYLWSSGYHKMEFNVGKYLDCLLNLPMQIYLCQHHAYLRAYNFIS